MLGLIPSGIPLPHHSGQRETDFKVYFQKSNAGNDLMVCVSCGLGLLHLIGLRQYSVFGHAHGDCGW